MEACFSVLDGSEKQRAARISNQKAMQEFVRSRAALRQLLSAQTGMPAFAVEFGSGRNGKPVLQGHDGVHFNLSHSGDMVFVAVAPTDVGIDIERIDRAIDLWGVAESVFSGSEIEMLRNTPPSDRHDAFFSLWTRKEAYLKATGLGFSASLQQISVAAADGKVEDKSGETFSLDPWHTFDLPAPAGYKAALATTTRYNVVEIVDTAEILGRTLGARALEPDFAL
jgi:4'-phosphopantetheinyl transferase